MFLEERIAALERQVVFLEEQIHEMRKELTHRAEVLLPAPLLLAVPDKPALTTKEAARLLNRAPQTLRVWATYENGPIRPQRLNRRLLWTTTDILELIRGGNHSEKN